MNLQRICLTLISHISHISNIYDSPTHNFDIYINYFVSIFQYVLMLIIFDLLGY